jgi:hypothetical protein
MTTKKSAIIKSWYVVCPNPKCGGGIYVRDCYEPDGPSPNKALLGVRVGCPHCKKEFSPQEAALEVRERKVVQD